MIQKINDYFLKSDFRYSGFLVGLLCAFVGSVLFTIIESIRLSTGFSLFFWFNLLPLMLFWSCMFSFIPAGIGGIFLGWLLQNQMQKGLLTLIKATKIGILVAGLTACFTCVSGVLFVVLAPHNYWMHFWDNVRRGLFFREFFNALSHFGLEIFIAITIACIAGAWAGRILAKRLLSSQVTIPPDL